jgi:hypothetical protein
MAGDWIKMRVDLASDPAVFRMADTLNVSEYEVVGMLHAFWSWADKHSKDGNLYGVTIVSLDRCIGVTGFAQALIDGDGHTPWLIEKDGGLYIPGFEKHNGKSAKTRSVTKKRVSEHRKNPPKKCNDGGVTKVLPEKRREEDIKRENKEKEIPPHKHPVPHKDDTNPILSLDDDTPTNKWLKVFQNNRPGMQHPLVVKGSNLSESDIEILRDEVQGLIAEYGERKATDMLLAQMRKNKKPKSASQAILYCNIDFESKARETAKAEKITDPRKQFDPIFLTLDRSDDAEGKSF